MTNIKPLILDPFSLIKPVPAFEIENKISFLSPIKAYIFLWALFLPCSCIEMCERYNFFTP